MSANPLVPILESHRDALLIGINGISEMEENISRCAKIIRQSEARIIEHRAMIDAIDECLAAIWDKPEPVTS